MRVDRDGKIVSLPDNWQEFTIMKLAKNSYLLAQLHPSALYGEILQCSHLIKVEQQVHLVGSVELPISQGSVTALHEMSTVLHRALSRREEVDEFNEWLRDVVEVASPDPAPVVLPQVWTEMLNDEIPGQALRIQDVVDSVRDLVPITNPLEPPSAQLKVILYFGLQGKRDQTLDDLHEKLTQLNILVPKDVLWEVLADLYQLGVLGIENRLNHFNEPFVVWKFSQMAIKTGSPEPALDFSFEDPEDLE